MRRRRSRQEHSVLTDGPSAALEQGHRRGALANPVTAKAGLTTVQDNDQINYTGLCPQDGNFAAI